MRILYFLLFFFSGFAGIAQSVGDYRSDDFNGDWSNRNDWERWNGSSWQTPTSGQGYPGQYSTPGTVTIRALNGMELNVSPSYPIGNLVIEPLFASFTVDDNEDLTINGVLYIGFWSGMLWTDNSDLTVLGTTTIIGSFEDDDEDGVTLFGGLVDIANTGDFNTTEVDNNNRLIFQGGIVNEGDFDAGTATFSGNNQVISGSQPLIFEEDVIVTSITVTNNGTVTMENTDSGTLSGTGTWQQGSGTLNYQGSTITVNNFNANGSGNTVNYNRNGNQSIRTSSAGGVYYHLTLSNDDTKELSNDITISGNLTITGTAEFDVDNEDVFIAGNWINQSTDNDPFLQGNGEVFFNGNNVQHIINDGDLDGTVFNDVTINNSYGTAPQIEINDNTTIQDDLVMTQGIVDLNSNVLTIGINAGSPGSLTHNQTAAAGWIVNGQLRRYFSSGTVSNGSLEGFFPVGRLTDFRPFYISCPSTGLSSGGYFNVSVSSSSAVQNVTVFDAGPPAAVIVLQHQGAWTISSGGINGGVYNITAGGTGFGTIGNLADVRLFKFSSAVGNHVSTTGTTTDPRLHRSGLSLFDLVANDGNQFFIGSVDDDISTLPVELLSFDAEVLKDQVNLTWLTAAEINNDYFIVERSSDLTQFESIGKIDGAGNSNREQKYALTDFQPLTGISYYRLTQVDHDGTLVVYNPVAINFLPVESTLLEVYPNPFNGSSLNIRITSERLESVIPIRIYNSYGALCYENTFHVHGEKVVSGNLVLPTQLKPGIYILKVGETSPLTQVIVVQ